MKTFRKSMLTLGTAVALGSFAATYAPAMAASANPCAPASSPCTAKPANPCTAQNPCAAHKAMRHRRHHKAKANPCAAKTNPCAAKSSPCAAKSNPCAPAH